MRDAAARSAEQEVLRLAREVAREMRPARAVAVPRRVEMGSSLERDLGLDSLGRAELVARLERAFAVRLPEEVLGSAETPADLASALAAAGVEGAPAVGVERAAAGRADAAPAPFAGGPAEAAPERTRSLVEVLEWHAERHPGRRHLLFHAGDEPPRELTYGDLLRRARQVAAGLAAAGVERGQAVALMLPSGHDYFVAFYGALLAGGVPVPLYPPARRSQIEDHLRRQAGILTTSQAVALITFQEVMTVARLLRAQVLGLGRVVTVAELEAGGGGAGGSSAGGGPAGDDVALLQFTSGSTGRPKGVVLTHANLLAQLRALGVAVGIGPQDVVVSWLPLYHDMGLIGAWMASLYYGMPLVLMSPLGFLAHPARWLQLLSRHRGTLSAAPNFAYELCARKVADDELQGIDLSAWRFALNGAEPVSPDAILRFVGRFRGCGFRPEAMAPVYGLAENSLALAIPPLGRGAVVDVVEREVFERTGRAAPVAPGPALLVGEEAGGPPTRAAGAPSQAADTAYGSEGNPSPEARVLRFVGCGMPLPEHELRIVDAAGHEVADRQEGRLQFRGPSATSGYFRNPEATQRLRHGDWLDSGDRAYVVGREVFLTGRDKDIVIRAGRNLYPHELEEAVGAVPGIRKGCVAVFGVPDRATGTERLVVLAETRETRAAVRERLREAVQDTAVALLGEPADEVVLAPPHAVPKTSSGKVRRAASRDLYLGGRIGKGGAAMGLQLARLALAGARVQVGRAGRAAWAPLYSAYVWTIFGLVGAPLWLAVAVLPGLGRRRRLARAAARLMFRCAGIPLHAGGLGHLAEWGVGDVGGRRRAAAPPGGPAGARREAGCLVAVNHASYLDAVALTAMLPPDFAFVAKRELEDSLLTRVMMRRLGALLVERFDAVQSAGEVPKAASALAGGESLVIFPEGTFRRAAGLRSFRLGGFLAAAQAGSPVFPAALRGTRQAFRDDAAIFRRGAVEVEVLPPILPDGDDWAAGLRLRDRVRAAMLERLEPYGEPDLAVAGGRD